MNESKKIIMEKNYGLIDLCENELKEISGGKFPMLVIRMFIPTIEGYLGFLDGLREGYEHTTPN